MGSGDSRHDEVGAAFDALLPDGELHDVSRAHAMMLAEECIVSLQLPFNEYEDRLLLEKAFGDHPGPLAMEVGGHGRLATTMLPRVEAR